jgi:GT2 family glycosyltransferase
MGLLRWLGRERLGESIDYATWIARHDTPAADSRAEIELRARRSSAPAVALCPSRVESLEELENLLLQARTQLHSRWELWLASSPTSSESGALEVALRGAARDPRVHVLGTHESDASAFAAAVAETHCEWICPLEPRSRLRDTALLLALEAVERAAHAGRASGMIYSDHDHLDVSGARCEPFFKPDFSPETAWSIDIFGPFAMLRVSLARALPPLTSAMRTELLLRASETAEVLHLPEVLAHRLPGALDLAREAADRAAIQRQLDRLLPGARAFPGPAPSTRRIQLGVVSQRPLISAIIPTRDGVQVLRRCMQGLLENTDWSPLEVLIVDNGSRDPETLAYLSEQARDPRIRVLRDDGPFNFSALNNRAAREARGELLALLNDDLEVLEPGWLEQLAGHALRPEIGAAGARLLYPDGRVQHAGIATGVRGLAAHLLRGISRDDPGPNAWAKLLRASTVVTAACLVIRRDLFLEIGGFDEQHLAVAFNDVDLCLRLAERGLRNLYVPEAELLHHESWSRGSDAAPEKRERFARELQTMLLRWPALRTDPLYSPNLTLASDQLEPGSPLRR